MATAKKKRASFKLVPCTGTVGAAVGDGFSALEDLASECREIVENAEGGLAETQRIQTLGETADTLENLSEPDVPNALQELAVTYSDQVPTDKRRSPSRATRCANACSQLTAAAEAVRTWLEENEGKDGANEAEELADALESAVSDAENCEFPGMFG